jgi:hypothetical protein
MARAVEPIAHLMEPDLLDHIQKLNVLVLFGVAVERFD